MSRIDIPDARRVALASIADADGMIAVEQAWFVALLDRLTAAEVCAAALCASDVEAIDKRRAAVHAGVMETIRTLMAMGDGMPRESTRAQGSMLAAAFGMDDRAIARVVDAALARLTATK